MTSLVPASHAFPLLVSARRRFDFPAPTFSQFVLARALADALNDTRDLKNQPELTVRAGRLAAAALLDEIFAHVIALYQIEVEADALERAPAFLDANLGEENVALFLQKLDAEFAAPTLLETRPQKIESALRLHLANVNPALELFSEIFDAAPLENTIYERVFPTLDAYFSTLPPFGDANLPLLQLLLEPILRHPDSVEDQLRFIGREWKAFIEPFSERLLTHFDLIREEEKPTFFGPGPALVPDYAVGMHEYEAFTADRDWMPRVVLLAKQTYVWLDQLSKKYKKHIYRLDQIPDEELDELAKRGITGLWLIGVWQRSKASQKIKQMTGNPDAIASAYSLYSYDIAWEIGGQEALDDLKNRAAQRGIRMASDMVPNHMAIDSKWMIEHPDWFLSLPEPPFPHSRFDTPDLCDDERVEIRLETGYYSRTDASVVFERRDSYTGDVRYVYHGNDGTAIPWNDTAQLNYLLPEVRHAAMETILHVARSFPIIRFDAAMTLAKRHYHRLWFPAPGSGGDIPSRAGRGLSADEFDRVFPLEFWREVVDRIAVEAPDTLLLAEAFWLMEGYFVRTLGMHRVYNSAFMNMLRDEENANYRLTLKKTLEFDPDILGRFVNFINNPDEETAAAQFGKADKYFGVCTLLATLPGLPMFGHGQIEGFGEKYGMEYPRAYWDETPDKDFIAHHERVIFPLLHKRHLFAGSENFTLYDFWNNGEVNEDVFAYSNKSGKERALVVFNNRYAPASGWIKSSVGFAVKNSDGSKEIRSRTLGEAFALPRDGATWCIFRDLTTRLEYLRNAKELVEKGLYVELGAYGCQTFLDWREVRDESGLYAQLAGVLNGNGVLSVHRALKGMLLEGLLRPWEALCDPKVWEKAFAGNSKALEAAAQKFARSASAFAGKTLNAKEFGAAVVEWAQNVEIPAEFLGKNEEILEPSGETASAKTLEESDAKFAKNTDVAEKPIPNPNAERAILLSYGLLRALGEASGASETGRQARAWLDDWMLDEALEITLAHFDVPADALDEVRIYLSHASSAPASPFALLSRLLEDELVQKRLGINTFERVIYFRGEALPELLQTLQVGAALGGIELPLEALESSAETAEFRVVKWMEAARKSA